MDEIRLCAFDLMFTLVRAIAPVAGIPPTIEETIVASP